MKPRKHFKTVEATEVTEIPVVEKPTTTPGITKDFLLAGQAFFKASNNKGQSFTYKVHRREVGHGSAEAFFVRVHAGNMYRYVGVMNPETGKLTVVGRSAYIPGTPEFDVAAWALSMVFAGQDIPEGYTIDHIGKCGKCGRTLSVDIVSNGQRKRFGSSLTGLHTEEEDCP
jgi:hypothetical protein